MKLKGLFFNFLKILLVLGIIVIIIGCSGNDNKPSLPPNLPPPSQPPDSGGENLTVSINPSATEIGSEETVYLTLLIQGGVPTNIRWTQSPSNPLGQFQQVGNNMWTWKAPKVYNRTNFTLTVTVTFPTTSREASTTITVSPPQPNPPVIQITYPWEDGRVNVVGDNIILTVKGYVYSRSNGYVNKIEAFIDNEKVAETTPNYDYFELDITRFGNRQGNKELIIRATTTDNAIGEHSLNIIYDNNLLYSLAVEFIRRYSCIYHEDEGKYRIVRFSNPTDGPYGRPVLVKVGLLPPEYHIYVQKACEFWTKYTGIQFDIRNETGPASYMIGIAAKFDQDPGIGAEARPGWQNDQHEITSGGIALYAAWLRGDDYYKIMILAHEIGYILLTKYHTQNNSLMDSNMGSRMLHTYQQLAVKIIYSKNPGDSI
ncbi:hypothetical protein Q2T83_16320 [Fervidibacter sacchari]|uniref:Uncharacterized protein n=1 Tax=Candidatus Fervidibacter sacchari TaxID=1448929 RepID=A0ABT2EJQ8_9BACT|nr:hypothetical protein [Candidatus Fervidibacter sacchari]MCS3918075.1 hypothetical protein [Candidatus Fervidibacter sacchari]WKU15884.1 hypothetical protein Q2T83_16320 [Candidatus Fervidibacter sacchari]